MLLLIKKHGSFDFCGIYTDNTYHIIYLFDVTRQCSWQIKLIQPFCFMDNRSAKLKIANFKLNKLCN